MSLYERKAQSMCEGGEREVTLQALSYETVRKVFVCESN